jgi:4-hydroxy-tetrahydrodipicolinate reductase
MGREVIDLVGDGDGVELCALIDRPGGPLEGQAIGGLEVASDLEALAGADVYIDFTTPASSRAAAEVAARHGVAGVIGTTGLGDDDVAAIDRLAAAAPALVAANFSLGVNLLIALAETASRALASYDAEVLELHHRRKVDAPSGTALALAEAVARGRDTSLDRVGRFAREGQVGPRTDEEIGVVAIRGGDIIGEHTVYLCAETERIELTHRAASRSLFADGALRAARWIAGKPAGRYSMRDVLGL